MLRAACLWRAGCKPPRLYALLALSLPFAVLHGLVCPLLAHPGSCAYETLAFPLLRPRLQPCCPELGRLLRWLQPCMPHSPPACWAVRSTPTPPRSSSPEPWPLSRSRPEKLSLQGLLPSFLTCSSFQTLSRWCPFCAVLHMHLVRGQRWCCSSATMFSFLCVRGLPYLAEIQYIF